MTRELDERAQAFAKRQCDTYGDEEEIFNAYYNEYLEIAKEQRKVDAGRAKESFDKACGWLSTYPWYEGVKDEFIKAMEK